MVKSILTMENLVTIGHRKESLLKQRQNMT